MLVGSLGSGGIIGARQGSEDVVYIDAPSAEPGACCTDHAPPGKPARREFMPCLVIPCLVICQYFYGVASD